MGRKRDDRRPAATKEPAQEPASRAPSQLPDPPRKNPVFLAIAAVLVVGWMVAMVWMALQD